MNSTKIEKDFDCIKMKRAIQAQIYEETKDMTKEELLAYYSKPTDQPFFQWLRSQKPE